MRTRTKLLRLGGAAAALLLLTYVAATDNDWIVVAGLLLFIGVSIAFAVVAAKAAYRWSRAAIKKWRAKSAPAVGEATKQAVGEATEQIRQVTEKVSTPEASGKSETDALLDEFIRDD